MSENIIAQVYTDRERRTTIAVLEGHKNMHHIPYDAGGLTVVRSSLDVFHRRYAPLEYDAVKAAKKYLKMIDVYSVSITDSARSHLATIAKQKEQKMAKKESTTTASIGTQLAAAVKKVTKRKLSAKKVEATTAPKKSAKKSTVKHAGNSGSRLRLNLKGKITIISKENPKRPGSGAHKRFALYKNGMTVEQFLKAGGIPADVHWDSKQRFIKVAAA